MGRFDERDVIFARMRYEPGTPQYEEYYGRRPQKRAVDDGLRAGLDLLGPDGRYFDQLDSPLAEATFRFLADIKPLAEGSSAARRVAVEPAALTAKLAEVAGSYGADLVGVTVMAEEMYYSHRGRPAERYGEAVGLPHRYGMVFACEMDADRIKAAPGIRASVEVTRGYARAALVGMILSYYLRELGYEARNHMDGNYLVVAPLVAARAGLGQIGRHGLLMTAKYGARVRLGVVTTDAELVADPVPAELYNDFCRRCGHCAKVCPAAALPTGDWSGEGKTDAEACFATWKEYGTDCGLCIAACPLSR